jgi:mRNA-degrading endonuclease YafQ of YafQ-DinJ toxin-antitoxin module
MEIEQTTKYKRELKKVLKTPNITVEKIEKAIKTFIENPEHNAPDTSNYTTIISLPHRSQC